MFRHVERGQQWTAVNSEREFFQIQFGCFPEISQGFLNGFPLNGFPLSGCPVSGLYAT